MLRKLRVLFIRVRHFVQSNFCSLSEEEHQQEVVVVVLVEKSLEENSQGEVPVSMRYQIGRTVGKERGGCNARWEQIEAQLQMQTLPSPATFPSLFCISSSPADTRIQQLRRSNRPHGPSHRAFSRRLPEVHGRQFHRRAPVDEVRAEADDDSVIH
jgi:hypothetical protein